VKLSLPQSELFIQVRPTALLVIRFLRTSKSVAEVISVNGKSGTRVDAESIG
jgi:hypothetical protein